eukprot:TRINITY_DN3478_c0_g1_i1.p1 TRINITY_DN3478_c0_g1~~TRINITY_DN3478_c0_g1_i1.p1  ORF type:complete len:254 (-),score=67.88 TRINITY_DN3478_c0_g1_i1:212-973(-)
MSRGFCAGPEASLAVMAANNIVGQIKDKLTSQTFVGRGQFYPDEDMDRFGLVAIAEDGSVEALRDGPLPASEGTEALCDAVQAQSSGVLHLGELDFNSTAAWQHGYFYSPCFGIFSRAGVVCRVEEEGLVLAGQHTVPLSDVSSVGVLLSDPKDECRLELNLSSGISHTLCTLPLSVNQENDDEEEAQPLGQMDLMASLVFETDWAIKASAQLTLALRTGGASHVKLGIAEDLHAKHNMFAELRNKMLSENAQ